jgi:hypothetical protein
VIEGWRDVFFSVGDFGHSFALNDKGRDISVSLESKSEIPFA